MLNLIGKIELDGAGFERGLHRAGEHVTEFAKNAAVAAFGFYGVEEAIKKTVETASELVNTSRRLDVTVEQLQLLRQAAKDGGTELSTLAAAFEKINIARTKALNGDAASMMAFMRLGVDTEALQKETAASIFMEHIAPASRNTNVANISQDLKEVLGKGFGELIPVMKVDFDELGDKMKKLGSIMDTDTAVKLNTLDDEFSLLSNILSTQLAPAILDVVEILLSTVGKIKEIAAGIGGATGDNFIQGIGSILKAPFDAMADKIPGKLGDGVQNVIDAWFSANFAGLSPHDALQNQLSAGAAVSDQAEDWKTQLDNLRARLKEEADALKNPPPIFSTEDSTSGTAGKSKVARIAEQTDSLVRVGNFLGSNGNTISRVDQQKINLLTKIEANTRSNQGYPIGMIIPTV